MTDELLPCPFCGGQAECIRNDIGVFVGCFNEDCPIGPATSTYVDGYATEAEAIAAWNSRAERTCRNTQNDFDFMCSECGKCVDNGRVMRFNYCPNCGARVVDE